MFSSKPDVRRYSKQLDNDVVTMMHAYVRTHWLNIENLGPIWCRHFQGNASSCCSGYDKIDVPGPWKLFTTRTVTYLAISTTRDASVSRQSERNHDRLSRHLVCPRAQSGNDSNHIHTAADNNLPDAWMVSRGRSTFASVCRAGRKRRVTPANQTSCAAKHQPLPCSTTTEIQRNSRNSKSRVLSAATRARF